MAAVEQAWGRRLRIAHILGLGVAILVAALAAAAVTMWFALGEIGVGGAPYARIVAGKDLVGDILPPPENVIEAYLEANLIYNGQGKLAEHKARLADLHREFEARRAFWRQSPLPDDIRHEIVETSGGEADAVWGELEAAFLPAAAAGDRDRLAASFARLAQHYAAHRAVIDDIVTKANAFVAATETDVAAETRRATASIYGIFGVIILGLGGAFVALRRGLARPVAMVAEKLAALVGRTSSAAQATDAQTKLDANLSALRNALHERGAPRIADDKLYFGGHLVNGETEIVDEVRRRFGGAATIFCGDVRVATNVTDAAGKRAIGTRLAPGPVHDKLFREGATFQGETSILGRNFVTIYEPILIDDKAVAAIFVGVPHDSEATANVDAAQPRNEVSRMMIAMEVVEKALELRNGVERLAIGARYQAADEGRRTAARAAAASAGQRIIVEHLTDALQKLAENDLTHRIAANFPAEYRALKVNFEHASATLAGTIGDVVAQAQAIFALSTEISESAEALSQRSEQQASSLEQSAASLNEIAQSSQRSRRRAPRTRATSPPPRTPRRPAAPRWSTRRSRRCARSPRARRRSRRSSA